MMSIFIIITDLLVTDLFVCLFSVGLMLLVLIYRSLL